MSSSRREDICKAIAGFGDSESLSEIERILDPLFRDERVKNCEATGGITPLIVACDKGNIKCLEYLKVKLETDPDRWSDVIGKPIDKTAGEGNTAFHHAAMAGCSEAISILVTMGVSPLELGTATNEHEDTPLMMAATAGHVGFCKTWHHICLNEESIDQKAIMKVWELKNKSQDSCLSLACGHGQPDLVDFLLSNDCGVKVDLDTVIQCQTLHTRMQTALRRNPSLLECHREQAENVGRCLTRIRKQLALDAEAAANDLLSKEDETANNAKSQSLRKHKQKNRGGAKRNEKPIGFAKSEDDLPDADAPQHETDGDVMELTTLPDGTKAVRVEGREEDVAIQPLTIHKQQLCADKLLRERFQQGINLCQGQMWESNTATNWDNHPSVSASSEIDSIMMALCLETPMLLYSPHGMAIDLSPSQLDAVQQILENQIRAVQEAKEIQQRLHSAS